MKLLLITSIFINFILILTIYIIYFTNKSTEYFAAIGQDILGGQGAVTIGDQPVQGTDVKESFTIKEYSKERFLEDDSFLMNDIDGNFINYPATKLNEILNIFEYNIKANTQSIAANKNEIGEKGTSTTAPSNGSGLYQKIEENAFKIAENQKENEKNKNNIVANTAEITGLNFFMGNVYDSLVKLLPLVDGKLCGSKDFENTRGSECKAIRYNDFMTIQNYGAKQKDNSAGWYLRVTGQKFPEFIKQSDLDSVGDKENRGIKTIWSIIPQATKTTTTTQRQPYENPIWVKT